MGADFILTRTEIKMIVDALDYYISENNADGHVKADMENLYSEMFGAYWMLKEGE